ncbi:hypothetical protein R5W24_004472 [Gemmata sp. JC717]|uniref:hypothetical protein n=1 Tax=Gemmata algarum TaxID=2975278 RepID=UPI0021BAC2B5|nr:hypothetical protein [Gemmata algarum]MDY3555330.1 hypothetical protein [Gemmata algarum]
MSVSAMAKKKPAKQTGVTLKVLPETLELVKKLAAMRGLNSLADLFAEKDVIEFLNHLYAGELAKEAKRLADQKRS